MKLGSKESVEEREWPITLGFLKEMAIGKNFASFFQQFFMRGAHTNSAKYWAKLAKKSC